MICNCFFEDFDLSMTVKLISFMKKDNTGYYIELQIPQSHIVKLFENDIIPTHIGSGNFKIKVRINNKTHFRIDNVVVKNFSQIDFDKIPISKVIVREILLEKYSKKLKQNSQDCHCYATKFVARIISKHRNLLRNGGQSYVYD